jgi:alkylhydroperoxidase/carboxymuconolactone decarboxylase family protein YurZ
MAYIHTIPPDQASGQIKEYYDQDMADLGYIANYTQVFSLRPEVYTAWRNLSRAIRSNMDPRRYELATIAAASALRCTY